MTFGVSNNSTRQLFLYCRISFVLFFKCVLFDKCEKICKNVNIILAIFLERKRVQLFASYLYFVNRKNSLVNIQIRKMIQLPSKSSS